MKTMQANILAKVTTQADMDHQKESIEELNKHLDEHKEQMDKFKRDNNNMRVQDLSSKLNEFKLEYEKDKVQFQDYGRQLTAIQESLDLQDLKQDEIMLSLEKNIESENPLDQKDLISHITSIAKTTSKDLG